MFPRSALGLLIVAGVVAHGSLALAALTDSEKGQLRSFFESADLATVSRMRALAARPDLTEAEAADALSAAVREQPFTPPRQRYLDQLMFGPASQASRAALVAPLSRALLSRADAMLRDRPGSLAGFLETEPEAFEELMSLHRFIGKAIGPDGGRGATIRNEPLRAVAQAYGDHVSTHAALMGHRNQAHGPGLLLRSQVALSLSLLSTRLSNREQVASWLGLDGVSRGLFLRTGAVLETSSEGPADRLASVARVLEAAPGALRGVSLVLVDKASPAALQPGRSVLAVRTPVGASVSTRQGWWGVGRGEEPDQALCEAAWTVSARLTEEATRSDAKHAQLAEAALQRAAGKGETTFLAPWVLAASLDRDAPSSSRPVSPQALATSAAAMLLVDAQRTLDLALSRWLAGQGHAFEQLMLGFNVLAGGTGGAVRLGRESGKASVDANLTWRGGMVTSFELEGHHWTMERSEGGSLGRLRIDGREPGPWALSSAGVPLAGAERWSGAGREWTRLSGAPRAAVLEDGRVIVAGSAGPAADAMQLKAPGNDYTLAAHVRIEAGEGGLLARASAIEGGFAAVALLLSCGSSHAGQAAGAADCSARLVHVDVQGDKELAAATPIGPQPPSGFEVKLAIAGKSVRASVGSVEFKSELTAARKGSGAGVTVGRAGRLEVRDVRLQPAGHPGPSGPRM